MNRSIGRPISASLLAVALILTTAPDSWAQKKNAPISTGAPTLVFPLPLGCQRGVPQELILTGTNLTPASQFLTGFPAKVELIPDEKLTAEGKVKVSVTAGKEVSLGLYPIRLLSAGGLSNVRLFAVDDLPQIVDNDANRDKAKPQEITAPCVVAGRTDAEGSDFYKIKVAAGQRLSFEVLGRRLGSPIDPLIAIFGGKNLREIALDNDSPGCQGDPRLSITFKDAGEYLVEIRDVLGRGGPDFVYRLRVGDFPLAVSPIPMAAKAGSKVQVTFAGPYVDGVKPVDVAVPAATPGSVVWVTPQAGGQPGWPVPLVVSRVDEIVESEPNAKNDQATRLPFPGGATGRILAGDLSDVYIVALKKAQKVAINAQTLEWGSPTLVYFTVKNAKSNAELAKTNSATPHPGDQSLEFTAPEDGDYLIEIQHLLYHGGPSEAYHLSVAPVTPTVDVILSSDRAESAPGATAALPFQVVRKGFTGPLEVRVRGEGVSTKLKANQSAGLLLFPSKDDAGLGARIVAIEAVATIDGQEVTIPAHARTTLGKALADLPYPAIDLPRAIAIATKAKAPFSLSVKLEPADATPGSTPTVVVTAKRDEGFDEEIAINPPAGLPANVGAKVTPIAKGKSETKFPLDVTAKATLGESYVLITGKMKRDKTEIVSDPAVLALVIAAPFDLTVEPANATLKPGEKIKLAVKATRKHGYKGPIALEVKNLPAKVTGGKATLNPDQSAIELELSAAADIPAGEVELEIVGSATALNNLAGSTPPVALRITKKE